MGNLIPLIRRGTRGSFFYDARQDQTMFDPLQNAIFYNRKQGMVNFQHVLDQVDPVHKTKFQEQALNPTTETEITTSPILLNHGIIVIDHYRKIIDPGGNLIGIVGESEVVDDLAKTG